MHITVTGSHGFIGNHLVKYLLDNNHYLNCWDLKIGKNISDFTLKSTLEDTTDLIIHLAALAGIRESFEQADEFWQNNVEFTKRVFDVAHKSNTRIIYASSSVENSSGRNSAPSICEHGFPARQ